MKNLIRKKQTLPLMRIILVIVSILVVLFVSLYWWRQTAQWENVIITGKQWYLLPELSRMEIRDSYSLVFKKIIIFGGFIFTSTFLLLKAIDDKK